MRKSNKNLTDSEIIIERLKSAYGINQSELGTKLGYSSSGALSNWKERGVQWDRIIENCEELNLNYLTTGEGKPFKDQHHKEFSKLKERLIHEDTSGIDTDLLIEVLQSDIERISNELQDFVSMVRSLRNSRLDE